MGKKYTNKNKINIFQKALPIYRKVYYNKQEFTESRAIVMKLNTTLNRLKTHPLLQVLADHTGNPRTLVLIEPLWGIPYNLIAPFATLYM